MSGVCALFQRDGQPVDQTALWAMVKAVPYRGSDGMWVRAWDALGLGFAKLTVTPEEVREQQPLVSRRTGCGIVADLRLDNREALLARLSAPRECSDAELALRAYEAWGTEGVAALLGDFAFVLWDPRTRRLLCARDSAGQRSLFYRVDRRTFAAASEIHQLLQDPSIPVEPDDSRIRDYLVPWNMIRNEKDRPDTFYRGIRSVAAGYLLIVDADSIETRPFWELRPPRPIRYRNEDEYPEHYRELFFEVVRSRLRSVYPTGVMLSGGLDSTSVACTAQELYARGGAVNHGFASFSSIFDGLECDERPFIASVQAKYGFASYLVPTGQMTGRLGLEPGGFQEAPDVGIAGGRDTVFSTVEQAGVRTLLTGEIADACIYGSRMVFDSLLRHGRFRTFWRHFQATRRSSRQSMSTVLALSCVAPLLPLPVQRAVMDRYVRRLHRRHGAAVLPRWMPQPLRAELSDRNVRLFLDAEAHRRFSNPSQEEEYRLLWPPEVSRPPTPFPLEIWRPFADRRLHEFLLAIPPEQKFEPHPDTDEFYAGSKWLVRRAMRGILPELVRTRTSKTVFSSAFERELDTHWPLYELAFGPGSRPEVAARGYVDPQLFWARLQELRAEAKDGSDLLYVARVLGLETWLQALNLPRPQLVTVAPARPMRPGTAETSASSELVAARIA